MTEKSRKTLYLPNWIVEKIDAEGSMYDGPGVVVAAAVHAFCGATVTAKRQMLKDYRQAEIDYAYSADAIIDAAEADTAEKKRSRGRQTPKSAG
jgi:hypothetical protein